MSRPSVCARSHVLIAGVAVVLGSGPGLAAAEAILAAQPPVEAATRTDGPLAEATRALAAGNPARAAELASAYLERHPSDPDAQVLLARVHLERGELEAAQARLERALDADPRNVDVLYYLGLVTAQLAATTFERIVEQAPSSARAHQLLAESFEAQDRRPEAEREYEAAVAAQPDLLDALLGLAKLKRIRLDCEGANPLYTKAETMRPTFDGAFGLGTCAIRAGDAATALTHFERAVERDSRAAIAHVGLASALIGVGRTAEAVVSLQRAIALEPEMGEAYYLLGRAYQSLGDRTRAQEAFAKAKRFGDGASRDRTRP